MFAEWPPSRTVVPIIFEPADSLATAAERIGSSTPQSVQSSHGLVTLAGADRAFMCQ
jgi:hypothetical protein